MEIMRLVIEIPKELYDKLSNPIGDEAWLRYIIKNGIPVSKEIDTMRKYQKIQQILKDIPYGGDVTVRRIQEVVEEDYPTEK